MQHRWNFAGGALSQWSVLVEVVARLGDTILDVRYLAGGTYRLGETELPAVPGTARLGLVDVTISPVARPLRSVPYAPTGDRRVLPYLAASLAVHVVICGFAMTTPPTAGASIAVTDRPVHSPRIGWRIGPAASGERRTAVSMALDVGAKKRSGRAIADAKPPGVNDDTTDDARGRIAELVKSMDASSSYDKLDTTGGGGGGGGGGDGGGFGGSRDGSIGIGGGMVSDARYDTSAGGDWAGAGHGGGLRARDSVGPSVVICGGPAPCMLAVGDLDKAIIRRYLRRELPKIQYCYEKQLLSDPNLSGTVATEFLIGADGKVLEAASQGLHEAVAACVTKVIRGIEFPRAKTQTHTRVTYPFIFRSAG